jgi:hypothetical protein
MTSTILGITGRIEARHFMKLDQICEQQANKHLPVKLVKIDPRCEKAMEWALIRGMAIVIEKLNFTYERNSIDEFTKLVVGEPTTPEDYATPGVEMDICNLTDCNMPITHSRVALEGTDGLPLVGDLLPDREYGRWVGPDVNMIVATGEVNVPRIEGIPVIRAW